MITYLVTQFVDDAVAKRITHSIITHHTQGHEVSQIFFYADAVSIGIQEEYSDAVELFIEQANEYNIALAICSAGFQKRNYRLSSNAEQDFSFKGLGQFVSESQDASLMCQFSAHTFTDTEQEMERTQCSEYNNDTFVSLGGELNELLVKEFLDIALVSAAYDMSTVVFMSCSCIQRLQEQNSPVIEQALTMIQEFSIPLLAATEESVYGIDTKKADYHEVAHKSRLVYYFGGE